MLRTMLVTVLAVIAAGCNGTEEKSTSADVAPGQESVPPSIAEIGNATIEGIYDDPILLSEGVFEGEPFVDGVASRPRVELLDYHVSGELGASPGNETAAFLSENSGGSGTFLYLAIMGRDSGKIKNLDTVLVGDRVQVRDVRIHNGKVIVDVLQAGPEDAMCCPGELATRTWILEGGELIEVPSGIATSRLPP